MARVLIIEDEAPLRISIARILRRAGHTPVDVGDLGSAAAALHAEDFDLVLTDVHLGEEARTGLDLVSDLRQEGYLGVAVVMTAYGSIETAVRAMRGGADDFLQKPIKLEELPLQVDKWLAQRDQAKRLEVYKRIEKSEGRERSTVGRSKAWRDCIALAERLASMPIDADAQHDSGSLPTVLLLGETGVGKGVLARHIHQCSAAAGRGGSAPPFVHVNCAALPATLVEAELFGHEKGAFTDAREARPGLFEMADGGTIFLDEISEMPLELQAKLLLVVERGVFRRVGGTKERHVRARVVAASNQDLGARSAEGKFRRDLFYRLNTFTITIPPLHERDDDARLIATTVLERLAPKHGCAGLRFSADALAAIDGHGWPGNVRELVNAVQRAVILSPGDTISREDLGLERGAGGAPDADGPPGGTAVTQNGLPVFDFDRHRVSADDVERTMIEQALCYTGGNVSRAAKLIGLTRAGMRYRIDRYKLNPHVVEAGKG